MHYWDVRVTRANGTRDDYTIASSNQDESQVRRFMQTRFPNAQRIDITSEDDGPVFTDDVDWIIPHDY